MTFFEPADRLEIDPAPDPQPRPPGRFTLPAGAVDTHAHLIGDRYLEQRSYTPRPASEGAYLQMLDAVGMTYGVLIQVSVHGTDNSLMLDALRAHPRRLRGVAAIPLDVSDLQLSRHKSAGVVGLRLNTTTVGGVGVSQLHRYAALCKELGWHLQFLLEPVLLPWLLSKVATIPVPIVIDHMGYVHAGLAQAQQSLLQLLREGAWVKLSAGYRLSAAGPPYADTVEFTGRLVAAAPGRCVWGSDWPHVKFRGPMPNPGDLLDLLAAAVPDPRVRDAILTDNAQRLYGFDAEGRG